MLHFPLWKTLSILGTVLLFTYFAVPSLLTPEQRKALPQEYLPNTVNLGLDLRGGSYLLLEVDFDTYTHDQLENPRNDVRSALRESKLGYQNIRLAQNALHFTLPEHATERGGSLDMLRNELGSDIDITQSGNDVSIGWTEPAMRAKRQQLIEQSIEIVTRRVDESGTKEPIIQRQGVNRILLQVPGLDNPEQLKRILGQTANMTFHLVNPSVSMEDACANRVPLGTRLVPSDDTEQRCPNGQPFRYPIYSKVELAGDMLTHASATFDEGQPVVSFRFNSMGAKKFGDITNKNIGKPFAIVLDDKVITAPRINSPILNGSGIITGNFTVESANDLALLLRAGALPAPLKIVEERTVGPSLGNDSIAASKIASAIAIMCVMVFMVLTYGLFGVFANIALIVNVLVLLGALAWFQATLTLPGIAGIVLTFGMAVDANVLIYERIREEIGKGRGPVSAVDSGFNIAFGTIVDSNLTTLIAAALLFYFGTGTIKGFAVTLSLGIISSMFSAIWVTKLMVVTWMNARRPKTIPI